MTTGSSQFSGGADMWEYNPIRNADGSIDVTASVEEYRRLADLNAKRDRVLRWLPRVRRRLVQPQVDFARANWEVMNRRNGF
jgi:hypothetical protein